jgi:hypothetical protein
MLEFDPSTSVVERQLASVCFLLRLVSQTATSPVRNGLSDIRRSRHWEERTPSSDSAKLSQLPCLRRVMPFEPFDQTTRFVGRESFVK